MKRIRIVMVDGEPACASGLAGQLARLGHDLLARTSGIGEAVTLARRFRAHLVLLDLNLAGSHRDVALLLQEELSVPVVLLTPHGLGPDPAPTHGAPSLPCVALPCADADLHLTLVLALRLHQAADTIRRQADQIQAMEHASADSFWVVEAGGAIRECNEAASRLTGYARTELAGMSLHQLDSGHPPGQIAADLAGAWAETGRPRERQWRGKDGRILTVELGLRGLAGPGRLICCCARDLTERKAVEDRLRLLTRAVENCPAAIVVTDTAASIEYVNPFFEQVTGYTAAEAIGRNPRLLKSGAQEAGFYRDLWATLHRGETWSGEFHNRRKDGSCFWEKATISPVRGPDGHITHYVAVKEDITACRQVRLDLIRARDEAEAASRAKDAFLANMSHELRTPLNVINGSAATLLAGPLPPPVREALGLSLQSGQHLLAIIEELLDFSSLQAGRLRLEAAPIELTALLEQVMRQVAELPAARALTLTLTVDAAVPARIVGDARRLRQVLLNLLGNAVKFTARGAVHLVVRPQLGSPARPGLHCSVVDTGPGLAAAHREIIFQRFTQADDSIARRYGGTGLGLAISRSFVELMDGELHVRSRVGIGSAFHFTFACDPVAPAADEPPVTRRRRWLVRASLRALPLPPAPACPPGYDPGAGSLARDIPLTVLAADDMQTNRFVVEMVLRHLGYKCQLVENGAEAVAAVKSTHFDLVLLDVQMPVMSGLEAATEICRLFPEPARRPKLVALTANALAGNREACLGAGMDDFLTKPLLPPALEACIRRFFPVQAAVAAPAADDWINSARLHTLTAGLPEGMRDEILQGMRTLARDDFQVAYGQVQAACAARDAAALATAAHGLKGCFQTLGWDRAAALCRDALPALRAGTFTAWSTFPAELHHRFEASSAAMARHFADPPPSHPSAHASLHP